MNDVYTHIAKERNINSLVHPLISSRHSPRAMSGEDLSRDEMDSLFEAARWAPSAYNSQPWRFIFAKKSTSSWDNLFNLLTPFNQDWCKNGTLLVVVISANNFTHNGKPSPTHSYDTGAAWANLVLQGVHLGLVVHGISGFDYEKAQLDLDVPKDFTIEAMIAIGKPAPKEVLTEVLQAKEILSQRHLLKNLIMEGKFQ